ncbi:predicted protein [Lichtheimia corymbifera JMRC:FSU:9682]|uniref:Uncharacterized protein n=1 Tax=Lichtheimia corymbifera JMRC:FSU:9682 TaxID=1263082 RepID=A0A068S6S3_9FUNG|nr:predicted protein [Lichtheimia corymbifera JMRC:FSU:9682]
MPWQLSQASFLFSNFTRCTSIPAPDRHSIVRHYEWSRVVALTRSCTARSSVGIVAPTPPLTLGQQDAVAWVWASFLF